MLFIRSCIYYFNLLLDVLLCILIKKEGVMLIGFPNFGFLTELSKRFGFQSGSQTSIEGHGKQAVVVAAGNNVYKVFASSSRHCGVTAHNYEVSALESLGGYEGKSIRTPELKSHLLFQSPFEVLGRSFVGVIEQSRMPGVKPNPSTPYQFGDIGHALGEFHAFLDQRKGHISADRNIIAHRMDLLKEKRRFGHVVLPGLRKRLLAETSKLNSDTSHHRYVHGDFHMGNVIYDGQKYGIIDLATVGISVPEQDMTALIGTEPDSLKEVFKGYAHHHKRKPSVSRVMTLHNLDLAIAAEVAHSSGQVDYSKKCLDRLQAAMS